MSALKYLLYNYIML